MPWPACTATVRAMRRRGHVVTLAIGALQAFAPAPASARNVVTINDIAPVYASPGGPLLKHGGDHVFEHGRAWVVHRRGPWFAVPTAQLPDGQLGWIRRTPARPLTRTRMLVRVDLSARRVWVTHGAQLLMTAPVAIGAPASPTPTASTSVDEIIPVTPGSIYAPRDYGPAIVALRLVQSDPSPGFPTGGIVAFHGAGTPDVGTATTAGCLRMRNDDVRHLARLVREGTPVKITR